MRTRELARLAARFEPYRDEFSVVFDRARRRANSNSDNFKTIAQFAANPGTGAIKEALQIAKSEGWLEVLLELSIQRGIGWSNDKLRTELQKITAPSLGFDKPEVVNKALTGYLKQICMVEVRDGPSGSGFLVGPHLVITSYHVVKDLIDDAEGKAIAGSGNRLRVVFDKLSDFSSTTIHRAHHDAWLVDFSRSHPLESSDDQNPSQVADYELVGFLDYVLISLADCPGYERSWVKLGNAVEPNTDSFRNQLILLQHPAKYPLRSSTCDFIDFRPFSNGERILYGGNAENGSSGGLLVNSDYEFVGLHQGATTNQEAQNTGILAPAIAAAIESEIGLVSLEQPDPSLVQICRQQNDSGPIIGRSDFQQMLWSCYKDRKIGQVLCDDQTQGKSFSYSIARACLPVSEHDIAIIDGMEVDPNAEDLAGLILEKFQLDNSKLPRLAESETSPASYVRDELMKYFQDQFDSKSSESGDMQRIYWLVFDHFDSNSLPTQTTSRLFLERLFAEVKHIKSLRLLLADWKGKVDGANASELVREEIQPPDEADLQRYLSTRYVAAGFTFESGEIARTSALVRRAGSRRIKQLSQFVEEKLDVMIEGAQQEGADW